MLITTILDNGRLQSLTVAVAFRPTSQAVSYIRPIAVLMHEWHDTTFPSLL